MSVPSYLRETSKKSVAALTLKKRVALLALACCIQMVYLPASNRVSGGIEPRLSIDVFPIWPIWVLPYVFCYILWFTGIVWIITHTEDQDFRSFIAACMLTFAIGASTFVLYPTYVQAATLEGSDIFTLLLRTIHEDWGRYAAFPSGHVYITTLLALFFSRWYPRCKFLWILILVIVSLSTLFTGQHYILDVIGGLLAALAGYCFGLWSAGFYTTQKQTGKRSGKRIASSVN